MKNPKSALAALVLAALSLAAPAVSEAAVRIIGGVRANVNPLSPPDVGRCGVGFRTVLIAPGAILSTGSLAGLGDFGSTQSHCVGLTFPTPITSGIFTYDFQAGDQFFGTYTGSAAFDPTIGAVRAIENLLVTGGTGRFLGATGSLSTTGALRLANGNANYSGVVSGRLDMPAVPEPATWAMMILGFGAAGSMIRRRRVAAMA